jgi:DNA-binding phage protein
VDGGKAIPRDYIKATVGFEQLGAETGSSPKSLIRMFGPTGNPRRATCSASSATCSTMPA